VGSIQWSHWVVIKTIIWDNPTKNHFNYPLTYPLTCPLNCPLNYQWNYHPATLVWDGLPYVAWGIWIMEIKGIIRDTSRYYIYIYTCRNGQINKLYLKIHVYISSSSFSQDRKCNHMQPLHIMFGDSHFTWKKTWLSWVQNQTKAQFRVETPLPHSFSDEAGAAKFHLSHWPRNAEARRLGCKGAAAKIGGPIDPVDCRRPGLSTVMRLVMIGFC